MILLPQSRSRWALLKKGPAVSYRQRELRELNRELLTGGNAVSVSWA
jgi:hypothetical protein